ncbi:MAG: alpha/beta fold hydrolase BchO [Pseudomonadota bacterium]
MTEQLQWKHHGHDWPNRESSRFVRSGSLNWHVQINGSGPVMLLVHGTGASTHSWGPMLPALAQEFTVVAVDLPGHAFTSGHTDRELTLRGMSSALSRLLHDLEVRADYSVGHSAGAAILVNMSLDQQLSAKSIISINGALLPFRGVARAVFPTLAKLLYLNPLAPRLFAWQADNRNSVKRLLEGMGSQLDATGVKFYARLFRSVAHVRATTRMMALWDLETLSRKLAELSVPLHLLAASNDQAVPAEASFTVSERVQLATVQVVSGLGHLAHEEDPEQFVELIRSVVADCESSSALVGVSDVSS